MGLWSTPLRPLVSWLHLVMTPLWLLLPSLPVAGIGLYTFLAKSKPTPHHSPPEDEAEHPLSCPTVNMHRLLCPFPPHYFNLGWLYNEELAIAHCLPGATVHNTLDTIQNMGCIEVFNLFWDDCSLYRSNGIHPNNVAVKCYLLICSMHQHGAHLLLKPHYTHKLS